MAYLHEYVHMPCRHAISVRTKAERVKQPPEPVWPATNMAVDRPFMSHGELHSNDFNFTTTKKRIVVSVDSLMTHAHTHINTVAYCNSETHDTVWLDSTLSCLKHEMEFLSPEFPRRNF